MYVCGTSVDTGVAVMSVTTSIKRLCVRRYAEDG
jgi:hypothetical protein